MTDGALRLIPEARVGHLGLYRDEESLQPVGYYESIPGTPPDAEIVVVDPMLATGGRRSARSSASSATRAAGALRLPRRRAGGPDIEAHPDVPILCAAVDRQLDERGYIRPGWATRATASSARGGARGDGAAAPTTGRVTAGLLDTTVAAAPRRDQRTRSAIAARASLERYVDAWERADVDALVALLRERRAEDSGRAVHGSVEVVRFLHHARRGARARSSDAR